MARDDRNGAVRHTEVAPADENRGAAPAGRLTATVRSGSGTVRTGQPATLRHRSASEGRPGPWSAPRPRPRRGRRPATGCGRRPSDGSGRPRRRCAFGGARARRGVPARNIGSSASALPSSSWYEPDDLQETYGCLTPHGLLDGDGRNGSRRAVIDEHRDHLGRLPRRVAEPVGVTKGRRHAITIRRPDRSAAGPKVPRSRRPAMARPAAHAYDRPRGSSGRDALHLVVMAGCPVARSGRPGRRAESTRSAPRASSQDRMRQLLDAVVAMSADLDLAEVLGRIVESATALVDARYGALGVISSDGERLVEFVTRGVSTEERAKIGHPPRGHGILGLLIRDPQPRRLHDIAEHPDSYGFPPNHPRDAHLPRHARPDPRRGLRQPLHGREAGSRGASPTRTRPSSWRSPPRPVSRSRTPGCSTPASASGDGRTPSPRSPSSSWNARTRTPRSASWRATPSCSAGPPRASWRSSDNDGGARGARRTPRATTRADRSPRPQGSWPPMWTEVPVGEAADPAGAGAPRPRRPPWRQEIIAAIGPAGARADRGPAPAPGPRRRAASSSSPGTRRRKACPGESMPSLTDFAQQAGLALLAGRAQRDRALMALLDDRDRIARDMHDHVIQRLFATGLSLQSAARLATHPAVQPRIDDAVDDIDAAIKEIRQAIYQLHRPVRPAETSERLEALAGSFAEALGLRPDARHRGSGRRAGAGRRVRRARRGAGGTGQRGEARRRRAARCARHGGRRVGMRRGLRRRRGVDPRRARGGLVNLAERAAARGGTFEILPESPRGTVLRWRAPR